jgi:hypothetical protein
MSRAPSHRNIAARLRKLERASAPPTTALIFFGPGETREEAAARHYEARPQDRQAGNVVFVNTGVPRHREFLMRAR